MVYHKLEVGNGIQSLPSFEMSISTVLPRGLMLHLASKRWTGCLVDSALYNRVNVNLTTKGAVDDVHGSCLVIAVADVGH